MDFRLSDSERAHPLWLALREHMTAQLAQKRTQNDNPDLSEHQTATLRGHIQCLKRLIALGDEPPIIPD